MFSCGFYPDFHKRDLKIWFENFASGCIYWNAWVSSIDKKYIGVHKQECYI